MTQKTLLDKESLTLKNKLLRTLDNETRVDILNYFIAKGPVLTNKQVYTGLGISQSFASTHTGILKNRGFLEGPRVEGRNKYYTLTTLYRQFL